MRLRLVSAVILAAAMLVLGGASGASAASAAPPPSSLPADGRSVVPRSFAPSVATGASVITGPSITAVPAGVDDFSFASFHGDYTLGRDADGRSTLTTVETLVAVFPDFDQNHGIRRLLVDSFDGHPTGLRVVSVTDEAGNPRSYEEETEDHVVSVTIAAADFVHGPQTYVITYTQQNVTRYFPETNADEFYWDVNGADWSQPFGEVTADVHADDVLRAAATGVDAASGSVGADGPADIAETDDGWHFAASALGPYQTLTFAIGFTPGTFAARDDGFFAAPWPTLAFVGALLALGAAVGAAIVRVRRLRDAPGRPTIIAEYLPPPGVSVLLAAAVGRRTTHALTAQLLQLAVLERMRVIEAPAKGWFSSKPTWELEYRPEPPDDVARAAWRRRLTPTADDLAALHAVFGRTLTPGERRSLGERNVSIGTALQKVQSAATSRATSEGYRRPQPLGASLLLAVLAGAGVIASFVFAVLAADSAVGGAWPWLALPIAIVLAIVTIALLAKIALEPKGAELRDHLAGLDLYIRLAEADRIRVLQSPQGAERAPIAADDPEQVLELNERLLPWAVLFGHEREWAEVLGRAYEQVGRQPDWYSGSHPFSTAIFISAISGVSSSATSSFASASSSSSGGSGGGASAGGGGGGGGGGGV